MLRRWRSGIVIALSVIALAAIAFVAFAFVIAWKLTRRSAPPREEAPPTISERMAESVRFTASDGVKLGAWFWPGNPERACVVVLHGNGGSRTSMRHVIEPLVAADICVFAVTLRAHGDSGGAINDFGWSARHDVEAAVAFLEARAPGRPITVFGSSLGAAAAIYAAHRIGTSVEGFVLESPYRDLRTAIRNRTHQRLPSILASVSAEALWHAGSVVLPVDPDLLRPADYIQDIPPGTSVVVLAGENDLHSSLAEISDLARRRVDTRLEVFSGAAHGELHQSDPARYLANVLNAARPLSPPEPPPR